MESNGNNEDNLRKIRERHSEYAKRIESNRKNLKWFGLAIVVVITLCVWQPFNRSNTSINETYTKPANNPVSMAQNIAMHDANSEITIPQTDNRVIAIQEMLYKLSLEFGETPDRIGEMTYNAVKTLKEKGVNQSIYQTLNDVSKGPAISGVKYAEFMAMYMVLKVNGQ